MLKFFRRIRRKLIDDRNLKRYLIYAIGEILLVVIGILIALHINAINNRSNDKQIQKVVLLKIRDALKKDTIDLTRLVTVKNDQIASSEYIINSILNPSSPIKDTALFARNMVYPFWLYKDNPDKTAFEMAKASGDLFKITNSNLLDSLGSYFSDIEVTFFLSETTKYINENHWKFQRKYRVPFEYLEGPTKELLLDYKSTEFPFDKFLKDFENENYYVNSIWYFKVGIDLIDNKIQNATRLMGQIDKELQEL